MAVDTFMAYVGVYPDVAAAEADYQLVKDLHTEAGLIDAYDAAVVERRDDGPRWLGQGSFATVPRLAGQAAPVRAAVTATVV